MNACRIMFAVAERDSATQEAASYFKSALGCTVRFAHNGSITVDSITEFNPSVLIIDLFLPKVDTFKICSEIRGSGRNAGIAIIALSIVAPNKKIRSLEADIVLTRPVDAALLVEVTLRALRGERRLDIPDDSFHGFWSLTV